MPATFGTPIARCPGNGVEAYSFPFFVARGKTPGAGDFLLLEVHLWHLGAEEREELGELEEIREEGDLERLGYPRDEVGVFVVG